MTTRDNINITIKALHIIWIVISFIFILGGNYYLTVAKIEDNEKRICELEEWQKTHMVYTNSVYNDVVIELKQIKVNLNAICKKLNIEQIVVPEVNMVKP